MAGRRLPLTWIIAATAVALVVAGATVLVLDEDDAGRDGGGQAGTGGALDLSVEADLPDSVNQIVLGALDGSPERTLGELFDGRPMVVNFFGSWCQPCLEEMPAFERVHQEHGQQVSFVGLAEIDPADKALATVEQTGVTYPAFLDPGGAALSFFRGLLMPTTVFLAADGEVLEVHSRPLDEDELRARMQEHFGLGGG